jgi:hypothetical protein
MAGLQDDEHDADDGREGSASSSSSSSSSAASASSSASSSSSLQSVRQQSRAAEWDGLSSAESDDEHPEACSEEYEEFNNEHEGEWRGDVWLKGGGESDSELESDPGDGTQPDEDTDDNGEDPDWIVNDTIDGTIDGTGASLRTILTDLFANDAKVDEDAYYQRAEDDEQAECSERELAQSDGSESAGQSNKDKESGREDQSRFFDDEAESSSDSRPVKSRSRRKKGDGGPRFGCEGDGCEKTFATRKTMLRHKKNKHKDS